MAVIFGMAAFPIPPDRSEHAAKIDAKLIDGARAFTPDEGALVRPIIKTLVDTTSFACGG